MLRAIQSAEEGLANCAEKCAEAFQSGNRIVYVGAGTSGRIAAMDAAEMPPTFGVSPENFVAIHAGGSAATDRAVEFAEDDDSAAIEAINDLGIHRKDVVIGIAASGKTPFVVAAVRHARAKGAWTCGIANNKRGPLLLEADLGILLDTGPEVLTGSTRLKAGTAQKLALNRISTAAMVLSGKVLENLMVDVKATNAKLQERCIRIVRELAPVTSDEAFELLEANHWNVREVVRLANAAHVVPK